MSAVTTHVLDTARGRPASGISVRLESIFAPGTLVGSGVTDADGRVADIGPGVLDEGSYRLVFETAAYFAAQGIEAFFPSVELAFTIGDRDQHYHLPLLLSPFGYTTYRGS
jgi:5-hydroxyisourate hydrolase